jgi:hypothetical protein
LSSEAAERVVGRLERVVLPTVIVPVLVIAPPIFRTVPPSPATASRSSVPF